MKKKKNLKKVLIVLAIIAALFVGLIVFFAVKELQEEGILKQEIINYANKDFATDDYSIEVKTTGDYAYIEEAVKKYYKELSDNVKTINYYLNDEELTNVLTISNLLNDRPDFTKSHTIIKNTKSNISSAFKNITDLCNEDTIKNLIDKDKLSDSDYYYDLYLSLMYTEKDLEKLTETKEEMETLASDLNLFLDKVDAILTFLEINDNYIEYTNDNITFTNDTVLTEYNTLREELTELANTISNSESNI